jgi:glyoxalase family protein
MNPSISGIHHVTAIAGAPQPNVDFYVGLLGLRMVKLTVNFDDPGTYHLYYGDAQGRPGSVLTFFPWPGAPRGARGTGQATETAFSVPSGSLQFWSKRLHDAGVENQGPFGRFGDQVLRLTDPDGLEIEIIAAEREDRRAPWERGSVLGEHAIRGFHSVTLTEAEPKATATLLQEALGFRRVAEAENRVRYEIGEGGPGTTVDVMREPRARRGLVSVGTVHHVAWRTPNDQEQAGWRVSLAKRGHRVTPVADRHYFRSIYFREPGGVLFEIATDSPGFAVDESVERLGTALKLPPWLEPRRAEITKTLPPLTLPAA